MTKAASQEIEGTTTPGFESVKALFAKEMATMAEHQAQLCVYHRGQCVVDLWADPAGAGGFTADSLVNVFSSGKSLEAIAVAWLVGRGLISYDDRITSHWPAFGDNGKDGLTVADLMRHEAGLASFDTSLDMQDLFTDNIKQNAVGRIIEQHAQRFTTDGKREYHALTRGWIVNELFRRVDPEGRTIGEFLRAEISGPLGADVIIGVTDDELARKAPVVPLGMATHLRKSLRPRGMGRSVVHSFSQMTRRLAAMAPAMRNRKDGPPPPFANQTAFDFFNNPDYARGETPSANANCSARGLARIAAMMAQGGTFEGREYVTAEAWRAMHEHPKEAKLGTLMTTRFTQGGVDCFLPVTPETPGLERAFNEGREGFYGWMGLGGSIFQWHPEQEIGFAFVPTSLHVLDFLNERGKRYQAEVLKCLQAP